MTQIPPYQPRSTVLIERIVGLVKEQLSKVLHPADVGPLYWPYAAMYIADVMRHNSTGRSWNPPAVGEFVA
eukprot:12894491-Prorocentrum_lima.AAC.1